MIVGISDRATFARLRSQGQQQRTADLRVRYLLAEHGDTDTKVAYVLTRKVGNAVVRNRIRRQIRGSLEEMRHEGWVLPQGTFLFIGHTSVANRTYDSIRAQVREVVEKIEKSTESDT